MVQDTKHAFDEILEDCNNYLLPYEKAELAHELCSLPEFIDSRDYDAWDIEVATGLSLADAHEMVDWEEADDDSLIQEVLDRDLEYETLDAMSEDTLVRYIKSRKRILDRVQV
jgi:hypothetical protein